MAGVKRPSFLKRQKEQKRKAKAAGKREAREARKQARADGEIEGGPEFGSLEDLLGLPAADTAGDADDTSEADEAEKSAEPER